MPKLYNRRDIMQECSSQIEFLKEFRSTPTKLGPLRTIQLFIIIFAMISKLAEYKSE